MNDTAGRRPTTSLRRRRRSGAIAAAAAIAIAITGCTATSTASESTPSSKDSIVIAAPASATHFVYDAGTNVYPGQEIGLQLNATLLKNPYSESSADATALQQDVTTFDPSLAESYEVSEDGLVYTFHLDQDAVSQASNPLTAADVVWSFQEKFDNPTAPFKFVSSPAVTSKDQIAEVDEHTVTFTITDPGYGQTLLALLSNVTAQVYDSTALMAHATTDDPFGITWAQQNPLEPIGFGAYTLASFDPTETVLEANPDFFGEAPAISKVVYRVVADSATRSQALRNGDVDVAENLAAQEQSDLASAAGVKVFDLSTNIYGMLIPITNKAPFDDPLVRKAMAYAIPYDQIIDNVYLGRASQPKGFLDPNAPGYTSDGLPEYTYDPDAAKDLLAQAGHADGLSFTLTVNADIPDLVAAAVQIQAEAADAGFTIEIDQQPSAAFTAGRTAGDFQAILNRDYSIVMTPPYELGLFTTAKSSLNYPKWEDPEFYSLLSAANALGDPFTDEAGEAYAAAEGYLLDQASLIFYANVQPAYAVGEDVSGWAWRSDNWLDVSQLSFE
jgi:peptide/nickel transport system substrate-binding protein